MTNIEMAKAVCELMHDRIISLDIEPGMQVLPCVTFNPWGVVEITAAGQSLWDTENYSSPDGGWTVKSILDQCDHELGQLIEALSALRVVSKP
jgi:hypothetical protein